MPVGSGRYDIQQHPLSDDTRSVAPMPANPAGGVPKQEAAAAPSEPAADYVEAALSPAVSPMKGQ